MNGTSLKALAIAAVVVGGGALLFLRGEQPGTAAIGAPLAEVKVPQLGEAELAGEAIFNARCASCHDTNAAGKDGFGPPLVHKIYEPSHHGDMAFVLAAQNGVQAHHWRFGNMPAQSGLTRADVDGIVIYVRELQRANGIN